MRYSADLPSPKALREVAALFLKLGIVGVGGPAAHIALMRDEVVRKRSWLTEAEFLDLLGATNLIPGPNSTELAIHIGRLRAGWPGLLIAGTSFIVPAFAIVFVLAWAYVEYRTVPQLDAIFYGVKPAVAAVVAVAVGGLARTAIKSVFMAAVAAAAALLGFAGVHELAVILGAGALTAAIAAVKPHSLRSVALAPIFWFFMKVGSVLFGSGYVLIAYLRGDVVQRWHWLTEAELLDAVAVGQITPGPLFTTATFVGYLLAGPAGAVVATAGIFLPAFIFVAASGPVIPRLRGWPLSARFLDGINAASVGVMTWVLVTLARSAATDLTTTCIAAVSVFAMLRLGVSSTLVILTAAAFGALRLLWAA
jgi:chromate transporter